MNDIHSNPLPKNQKRKSTVNNEPALPRGYRRADLRGTTYYVPGKTLLPVRMYDGAFGEMKLDFAVEGKAARIDTINSRHDFIALTDRHDYEMTVTLSDLPFNLTCENEPGVMVVLYRQGTPNPLHAGMMLLCNDELVYRIPSLHLPAGKYSVLFAGIVSDYECLESFEHIDEMPVFEFEILEHGANLPHPSFSHHVPLCKKYMLLDCVDGTYNDNDEYRYVCFTDNYRPVYERVAERNHPGHDLTLYLIDAEWPVADQYHMVLYHNNEPLMAVHYTTTPIHVVMPEVETLTATSPMYVLAKQVLAHPMKDDFCNEPGCKAVKELVLKQLAHPDRPRRSHMAVSTCNEPSYPFICSVLSMLYGTGQEDYENMNPAFLQGEYERTGAACFARTFKAKAVYMFDIPYLLRPENAQMVMDLDAYIAHSGRKFHFFGTASDIQSLLARLPESRESFSDDHCLNETLYTPADITYLAFTCLKRHSFEMTPDSLENMRRYACDECDYFAQFDRDGIRKWVENQLVPYLNEEYDTNEQPSLLDCMSVDIDFSKLSTETIVEDDDKAFDNCMAELNRMVGLKNLKESLETMFSCTKFDRMRVRMGLPALTENRHHMIFTGNPGTGKTTVAKMIGKVFKELGILSKGEVIEAERADMVGKYIGHTEDNMKKLLERAKGNVLFIDEAYSLCDNRTDDRVDYGNRALECLLTALADNDSDLIVIMAGYEQHMNRMLESNPGMSGRFPYQFNFEDYTAEELTQICVNKLVSKAFTLTPDVETVLSEYIRKAIQTKDADFHNARWAEQLAMVGIVSAMAGRMAKTSPRTTQVTDLCNILAEDVVKGYELTKRWGKKGNVKQPMRSIGFR